MIGRRWEQHNDAADGGGIGGKIISMTGASSGTGAAIAELSDPKAPLADLVS
jgi:hypothetical protein